MLRHLTSLTQILAQEKIFPFLQGRHAVARRPIKCGTPIGLESPIVSSLYPEKLMTNCSGCFKAVVIPVPCRGCAAYPFCSRDCRLKNYAEKRKKKMNIRSKCFYIYFYRDKSWSSYHQYECCRPETLSTMYQNLFFAHRLSSVSIYLI